MTKVCKKCGLEKPLSDFYKKIRSIDGYRGYCKSCWADNNKKYYAKNKNSILAAGKDYRERNQGKCRENSKNWKAKNTQKVREYRKRDFKKYCEKYPEKVLAHRAVNTVLKNGSLIKQPCEECSNPNSQAHHDDYSKPLEVRWLCTKCHTAHHMEKL